MMNNQPYRQIFVLLGCSVLLILFLQSYWIRDFYMAKTERNSGTDYDRTQEGGEKIHEQVDCQMVKMTYIIQNGDTLCKTPSRNLVFESGENVQVINRNMQTVNTHLRAVAKKNKSKTKDSLVICGNKQNINLLLAGKKAKVMVNNNGCWTELKLNQKH